MATLIVAMHGQPAELCQCEYLRSTWIYTEVHMYRTYSRFQIRVLTIIFEQIAFYVVIATKCLHGEQTP